MSLTRTKALITQRQIDEDGYIHCEWPGCNETYLLEDHHIIYRSEKPGHENLHEPPNLIRLCKGHHDWIHESKANRNQLVEDRRLYLLFGNDVRNK